MTTPLASRHRADRAVVAVREHAALRRAGGARRVDERERVVEGERLRRRSSSAGSPLRPRSRRSSSEIASPTSPEGSMTMIVSSSGRRSRTARILAICDGVLADDRLGARVADDPLALLGRVRRVDRHDDRAGLGDRRSRRRSTPAGSGTGCRRGRRARCRCRRGPARSRARSRRPRGRRRPATRRRPCAGLRARRRTSPRQAGAGQRSCASRSRSRSRERCWLPCLSSSGDPKRDSRPPRERCRAGRRARASGACGLARCL